MAGWNDLRAVLDAAVAPVRLTWPELERIVGGLPPSAGRHRAWWSGDRPHVHVWQSAGYRVSNLVPGAEVTFVRGDLPARPARGWAAASVPLPENWSRAGDLLLVTCVKEKLDTPAAAKDLYVSPLFRKERAYAERRGVPWFILSAEHGLVAPDEWLAPYDRYLPDTPAAYRAVWGRWVVERLELLAGHLADRVVEVHASAAYVAALAEHLDRKGATLTTPIDGLTLGERLAWYDAPRQLPDPGHARVRSHSTHTAAAAFIDRLRAQDNAVTPQQIQDSHGAGLTMPGLYSWWVDPAGAADLTRGLELPEPDALSEGLIYAGLAGATRWPSGKRSTNTLWSRIAGMHLGSNYQFSTFRKTLGAILAQTWQREIIEEPALTRWMLDHLMVIAVPYDDADSLGRLEGDVLAALDPPLNLQGMSPSRIRSRITTLRGLHR